VAGPDRCGLGSLLLLADVGRPMELTSFEGEGCVLDVRETAFRKTLFYLLKCNFGFKPLYHNT
jgi:hypothetical protein